MRKCCSAKSAPTRHSPDAVRLQRMSDFRPSPYFSHNATTRRKNGSPIMVGSPPCRKVNAVATLRGNMLAYKLFQRLVRHSPVLLRSGTAPLFQDRSNMCNQYCRSRRRVWPLRDNLLPPCQTSPLKIRFTCAMRQCDVYRRQEHNRMENLVLCYESAGRSRQENDLRGNKIRRAASWTLSARLSFIRRTFLLSRSPNSQILKKTARKIRKRK